MKLLNNMEDDMRESRHDLDVGMIEVCLLHMVRDLEVHSLGSERGDVVKPGILGEEEESDGVAIR